MNKLDGKSLDIVSENVTKLKELFPEVFSEGKIDFDKLQEELGAFTDKENERYNFTWNGKQEAKRIAQTPSTGTLRPSKEDSKDWDTTQNLYIEGDNLEVLKLLQKSYHKQVKMIYIDPPYNTGKDFVYKDNFKDNIKNYMEQTGQVDSEGNRLSTNSDTNGRYHSDWLSMMYPRLKLARNLLKDDGVIFISIDEVEYSKLRNICDEIFGETNHIADLVWQNKKGGGNDSKYIAVEHEYVLIYAKYEVKLHSFFEPYKPEYLKRYKEEDSIGLFFWDTFKRKSGKQYYAIECPDGTILEKDELGNPISWLRSEDRFLEDKKNNEIKFVKTKDSWNIHFKQRLPEGKKPRSIFLEESILNTQGTTSDGSSELLNLFEKNIFQNPKPSSLIKHFLTFIVNKDELILDFFSGSATTAHSVMSLNIEDNGNRKYICVQLPENLDESLLKAIGPTKATIKTAIEFLEENNKPHLITEIGKERIRRAGEKIIADNPDKDLSSLDVGFKVYKLDSSNIKEWDSDFDNLEANLLDSVDNIKSDRTSEDLLYEILLKYGLDLTLPIEEKTLHGKIIYNIGYGALVICLDDEITIEVVEAIAEFIKEQVVYDEEKKKRHARVVFKDKSFADTNVKTNAIQVLKQYDIDDVVSI